MEINTLYLLCVRETHTNCIPHFDMPCHPAVTRQSYSNLLFHFMSPTNTCEMAAHRKRIDGSDSMVSFAIETGVQKGHVMWI